MDIFLIILTAIAFICLGFFSYTEVAIHYGNIYSNICLAILVVILILLYVKASRAVK
jgi:hypothetical protein